MTAGSHPPGQDPRLEAAVGRVLQIGVTASSVCLAAGLLLEIAGVTGVSRVLLNVGLVVLLATPVGRVVISVVEYVFEKDWGFVTLTLVVLLELMGSVFAAFRR